MYNISKIKTILSPDFESALFDAAMSNLSDTTNTLRYNNFAYAIRELSRHILHRLAPTDQVVKCTWFKPETEDALPTRAQRAKYAIQGGLPDKILKEWGFNIANLKKIITGLTSSINSLSKYTHINPEVFNLDDIDVVSKSDLVLKMFEDFVETIFHYKSKIIKLVEHRVEDQVIESVFTNYFEGLDSIAPHYSLDYCEVTDYHVDTITEDEIVIFVSGDVHVTLEYGSRKERSEGDGLDIEESFPYKTNIRYLISEDMDLHDDSPEIDDFGVDTSSWYDNGDEYT